jgi:hypothetical protein
MNKFLVNFGDRVGSTAVQAFAGSLGSVALLGAGNWKAAVVTALGAALFAAVKVLGVSAAQAKPAVQTEVAQVVATAKVDANDVAKAIGAKLSVK